MKRTVLTLILLTIFSFFYAPLGYSETKKPEMGTEKKSDCKECHSRSKMIRGSAKPAIPGQPMTEEGKLTPPPDHIQKDKRKNKPR